MTYDAATWGAFACVLSALAGVLTWHAFRSRGLAAGLRGVAWTLLPLAAWLTGTLRLAATVAGDVAAWATRLVFSPIVWFGIALAGVSVVLFGVSRAMRARSGGRSRTRATRATRRSSRSGAQEPARVGPAGGTTADPDLAEVEAILRKHGIS